jgi:hypothetical protein
MAFDRPAALSIFLLTLIGGCQAKESPAPPPPGGPPATVAPAASVRVTDISVGRAIGPDKRVTQTVSTFAPSDTIYASVATEGASTSATLTARWTYGDGQAVDETSQTIAPTGPAVTEFHLSKPDGWPKGNYQVEILVNGVSAGTRRFTVG